MTDKQIMINGEIYNYCNGCELWNGHHCTGDRSYEFNGENHRIICDKHMAHQFWKIRYELIRKTQECKKLREANDEKNKFLQDLGISAGGEFKRIKLYIESLKNKYNEKVEECEKLKKNNQILCDLYKNIDACQQIRSETFDRYREALEEIEEYIYTDCEYNDGCDRNICIRCKYSNVHDKRILDIINKAKGEEKSQ